MILTNAKRCSQADQRARWTTLWKNRLEDVVGECQGRDSISGGEDNDHSDPEIEESGEVSVCLVYISIISAGSGGDRCVVLFDWLPGKLFQFKFLLFFLKIQSRQFDLFLVTIWKYEIVLLVCLISVNWFTEYFLQAQSNVSCDHRTQSNNMAWWLHLFMIS